VRSRDTRHATPNRDGAPDRLYVSLMKRDGIYDINEQSLLSESIMNNIGRPIYDDSRSWNIFEAWLEIKFFITQLDYIVKFDSGERRIIVI